MLHEVNTFCSVLAVKLFEFEPGSILGIQSFDCILIFLQHYSSVVLSMAVKASHPNRIVYTAATVIVVYVIVTWKLLQNYHLALRDNTEKIYQLHTFNQNITVRESATHGWDMYRLGDMYKNIKQRSNWKGYKLHKTQFPASIAVEYMDVLSNHSNEEYNYTLMAETCSWQQRTMASG